MLGFELWPIQAGSSGIILKRLAFVCITFLLFYTSAKKENINPIKTFMVKTK